MRTLRSWMLRLRGVVLRRKDERDLSEQIQADIELQIEDGLRAGMGPEKARRAALLKLGGVDSAKEAWRDRHGIPPLESIIRDVNHALRVLGRNKAWAAVAILSLALGIGANAAMFSAANGLLLRKMPVPRASDLVTLRWEGENRAVTNVVDYGFVAGGLVPTGFGEQPSLENFRGGVTGSYETFRRLTAANETLEHLFAVAPGPTLNFVVDGQGDTASSQFVSGEFYAALEVPPSAGRVILPADDQTGAPPVAVISHGYWQRRFGADPEVVGKQVRANAVAFTIVGVSGADLPNVVSGRQDVADISIPLATEPEFQTENSRLDQPTAWWLVMMGRLKRGMTPARVQANLDPVFEQAGRDGAVSLLGTLPAGQRQAAREDGFGERIPNLHVVSGAKGAYDPNPQLWTPMAILSVLVGIVLLVVCVNLVNLSLALTTHREREIAVRRAVGATRGRLFRQILTEHVVTAFLGGAVSLVAASVFQDLLQVFFPTRQDWTVVGFAFVLALATGILVGIVPGGRASRAPELPPAGSAPRHSRLASVLLVAQVALSLALLVGAGLFLQTLSNLENIDPGFNVDNVAIFTIEPGSNQYDDASARTLYEKLIGDLRAVPGVSAVSFSSHPLLGLAWSSSDVYAGRSNPGDARRTAYTLVVQEDFFETMRIPLLQGRAFTARDNATAPQVAIINQSLARALFGGENPVGRRFGTDSDDAEKFEIVGVAADTRPVSLRAAPPLTFYRPHRQSATGPRTFEVRTVQRPEEVMPAIRRIIQAVDPALPIIALSTQASAMEIQWRQERIIAIASGTLGGLALVVSMIGLFGLMSYSVARRTREIAIRMALGGDRGSVLRSVLRESLFLVVTGILIGLAGALAASRSLESLLFGLTPTDPKVIAGAVFLMLTVAALAGYLPARRAAHVDPMAALRDE